MSVVQKISILVLGEKLLAREELAIQGILEGPKASLEVS
jgi:hypothetical protein